MNDMGPYERDVLLWIKAHPSLSGHPVRIIASAVAPERSSRWRVVRACGRLQDRGLVVEGARTERQVLVGLSLAGHRAARALAADDTARVAA